MSAKPHDPRAVTNSAAERLRDATRVTSARLRRRRTRRIGERLIEASMLAAALLSVLITAAIVWILVAESAEFFARVPIVDFLTDSQWTPLFDDARFGIAVLLSATLTSAAVALAVAVPVGTAIAIYLSEFADEGVRELAKPVLELLGGVPTVVYGYFALIFVTPLLQRVFPELPGFNLLSAGLVMGIMIIPYVSSLTEDAMRAVPMPLREASYAMGANRLQTVWRVVMPSAGSGIGSAYLLGISRAMGETMIVAVAAGMQPRLGFDPAESAATVTAYIVQVALGDVDHGSVGYQTVFAAGLSLLLMTLMFNLAGHVLRRRYRGAGA